MHFFYPDCVPFSHLNLKIQGIFVCHIHTKFSLNITHATKHTNNMYNHSSCIVHCLSSCCWLYIYVCIAGMIYTDEATAKRFKS